MRGRADSPPADGPVGVVADSPRCARLTALANRALALAVHQPDASPAALAQTLYVYNRVPATPAWLDCWPDATAVSRLVDGFLPLGKGPAPVVLATPGWLQWQPAPDRRRRTRRFKIYVSPRPEALRDMLAAVVPLIARHGAPAFKLAADGYGLLRADKCVIYVDDRTDLSRLITEATDALDGCPAQGVPFTASVNGTALLTWGVDPTTHDGNRDRSSWRVWLTAALGAAISTGRGRSLATDDVIAFARGTLEHAGVDTTRWAPRPALVTRLREVTA